MPRLLLFGLVLLLIGAVPSRLEGKPMSRNVPDPAQFLDALAGPPKVAAGLELIQQWSAVDRPRGGMLVDRNFEHCRQAGMTSIQNYVHWSEVEPEPGKFDWSYYDVTVQKAKKHGLKFVPFIIAGPYYSTPKWFRDSKESVFARCLEHDTECPIQSIWNPNLREHVDRYLRAVAEHYRPMGVLESVELGISGNWGEAIYPASGGFHWTAEMHSHYGLWCGDHYARADFRKWLAAKYKSIDRLNEAWGGRFDNFGAIEPVVQSKALSDAAWLDEIAWYYDSMDRWSDFWLATARKYFPTEPIYLCTGGNGAPCIGADFSSQAKLAKKHDAGIRITNMGEDFAHNFALTRLVGAACRFYDSYFTTEEAGFNNRTGVIARVFDLATCGAKGGYFKTICRSQDTFLASDCAVAMVENIGFVKKRNEPSIQAAVLWPSTDIALHEGLVHQMEGSVAKLRDYFDFDYIDETIVRDGALSRYRYLILLAGDKLEERAAARLAAWVEQGGVLLAARPWETIRLPGEPAAKGFEPLFDVGRDAVQPREKGYVAAVGFDAKDFAPLSAAVHNTGKAYPWQGMPQIDGKPDGIYASQVGNRILRYDSKAVKITESAESR